MEIKFALRAIEDVDEIYEYLAKADECVAQSVLLHIEKTIDNLRDFPEVGKNSIVARTREMVVPKLPYIIIYEVADDVIFVLTIFNTSRDPDMKFFT